MTQHLRHSVFSGRRAGESGGVALDDVTATEAGVLEGEPPRAGELLGELLGAWPLQPAIPTESTPWWLPSAWAAAVASPCAARASTLGSNRAALAWAIWPSWSSLRGSKPSVEPARSSDAGAGSAPVRGRTGPDRRARAWSWPAGRAGPRPGRPWVPLRQEGDPGDDLGPALGQRLDQLAGDANRLRGALDDPGPLQPEPS